MNQVAQKIIHCPNCKDNKDYVNMGSISTEGYVILKRQFGKFTMVMADEYSIICQCGYFIRINNGKLVATALPGTYING